jgi:hypothetical protein
VQYYKRTNDFIMRNVGGESLLVPLGTRVIAVNGVIVLNGTARCVWELLAQERSLDELAAAVAERFTVDVEHARVDVQRFLDEIGRMRALQP